MKVIFLDFDGPLTNARTNLAFAETLRKSFDPIAAAILNNICEYTGAKIVCTSARAVRDRKHHFEAFKELLSKTGFDLKHIHSEEWSCNVTNGMDRAICIKQWLERHPEVKTYAIIDDETVEPLDCLIKVNPNNGLCYEDIQNLAKVLDFDLGEAFNATRLKRRPDCYQIQLNFEP